VCPGGEREALLYSWARAGGPLVQQSNASTTWSPSNGFMQQDPVITMALRMYRLMWHNKLQTIYYDKLYTI